MHEHCDGCGKQTPVLTIFFNGRQFLCPECAAQRSPKAMGLGLRHSIEARARPLQRIAA
jgi:hypothetical protein